MKKYELTSNFKMYSDKKYFRSVHWLIWKMV